MHLLWKLFLWVAPVSLFASDYATFSNVETLGSGCPSGSVGSVLSPDATTLSLLFDSFNIELLGSKKEKDELVCFIKVNVKAPTGKRVLYKRADIRGVALNGIKSTSRVTRRWILYDFGKVKIGGIKAQSFPVEKDVDYTFDSEAKLKSQSCGGKSQLWIEVRLSAKGISSYTSVDSLDLSSLTPDGGVELIPCKK